MKASNLFFLSLIFLVSLLATSVYLAALDFEEQGLGFVGGASPRPSASPLLELGGIQAESFVVASLSGEKLAGRNETREVPIASLTKTMTALVAIEYGRNASILISPSAKSVPPKSSSLPAGTVLGLESARTLLLVESDNDIAEAIAESVGPLIDLSRPSPRDGFVRAMNKKAQSLGMSGTHFENPTGLDGTAHYSTAEDLARLANYIALKYPDFWSITAEPPRSVQTLAGRAVPLHSTNLLKDYPGLIGAKTGLSDEAEGALILRYRMTEFPEDLTIVILRSPDRFRDGETILKELKRLLRRPQP